MGRSAAAHSASARRAIRFFDDRAGRNLRLMHIEADDAFVKCYHTPLRSMSRITHQASPEPLLFPFRTSHLPGMGNGAHSS